LALQTIDLVISIGRLLLIGVSDRQLIANAIMVGESDEVFVGLAAGGIRAAGIADRGVLHRLDDPILPIVTGDS